jgi:Protein of unknown function (DUF1656)
MHRAGAIGLQIGIQFGSIINRPEFRLGEVLVPWTVIIGALGFLAAWLVVMMMQYTGLSRHVWHLPLFFLGLVILCSSAIGLALSP